MTTLRLATFNVLYERGSNGPGSWAARRPLLRRAIEATRADILALQEVLPSKLADVADMVAPLTLVAGPSTGPARLLAVVLAAASLARSARGPRGTAARASQAGPEYAQAGEHLPIAYRADRFDLLETGHFWISANPDRPGSMLPLAPSPFLVHWARLAPREGPAPLLVLNAHFGHAPWHHAPTARIVTARIAALEDGSTARHGAHASALSVFLVGDFNAVPSSGLLRSLTSASGGGFVDAARSAATRAGPPVTFHWGSGSTRLGLTLDHVLARTPLRPEHAEVVRVHEGRRFPSDHHPLVVEFGPPAA